MTEVTIAVCTANRPTLLSKLLSSLREQTYSHNLFEILIIDNGTDKQTESVVRLHVPLTDITTRYVHLTRPSLSMARNCAIDIFQGDILVFLDDDVYTDPTWLEIMMRAWKDFPTRMIGAVGGKILPDWAIDPGVFNDRRFWWLFSLLDYHRSLTVMKPPMLPFGANFALSRQAVEAVGYFDESLGRRGKTLLSGEEMKYLNQVRKEGYDIVYTPHAVVHHRVEEERLNIKWVLKRSLWEGITLYVISVHSLAKTRRWLRTFHKAIEMVGYGILAWAVPATKFQRLHWKIQWYIRWGFLTAKRTLGGELKHTATDYGPEKLAIKK